MAVTKRTRFEVLRRDNHTCQYCGAKAPDVTLQIDHVVPVALGGDDKPSNLVTACKDCNGGKSSIPPDSPLVAGLSERAAAYALGMVDKMTRFRADLETLEAYEDEFMERWAQTKLPLPIDYRASLYRWKQMGIPAKVFDVAVPAAQGKYLRDRYMDADKVFSYAAGVVWTMVNEREIDYSVTDNTAAVLTRDEVVDEKWESYQHGEHVGYERGYADAETWERARDLLAHHIDRTYPVIETNEDGKPHLTGGVRRVA